MKVLVTGGAGFIGHHLVRALLARDDEVVVLDNLATGLRERLTPVEDRIRWSLGDLRDPEAVADAVDGCDVILHQAAIASVERSIRDPRTTNDVNVNGTVELMLAAGRAGVGRLVFAGSSSVYGDRPTLPSRETERANPRSPYAASKLAGESYIHTIGAMYGIETVVLRYFNIFGPGQDPASQYAAVVPRFVTAALTGERPIVNGDGTQTRDFTYIDNAVSANLLAASAVDVGGLTCNIGCGDRFSLLDLLAAISAATGTPVEPVFGPGRAGDVPDSQADIGLAQDRLGYRVVVPFAEGVRRSVAAYRESLAARA